MMKNKQRNPPIKEETKQVGNTIFIIKSVESPSAKQTIKNILKKRLEQQT